MRPELNIKWRQVLAAIRPLGRAAVALSGGVDSALVCRAAAEALNGDLIALHVAGTVEPAEAGRRARRVAEYLNVLLEVIEYDDLSQPEFRENGPLRCYYCKRARFSMAKEIAARKGFAALLEGTNAADGSDYRPGERAVRELGVASPLKEAGLDKNEVRELAREFGIPVWDAPSAPCLATRFPYRQVLTQEDIQRVRQAEDLLQELGCRQLRVRVHQKIARIEVEADEMKRVCSQRETICRELRRLGFEFVTLDLDGFRSGSMNETLQ